MWKWVDWPEWLRAASYVACSVLVMVLVEIVRRRVVIPAADQFDRALAAASRAARVLVATATPPRNERQYILTDPADMTWTGQGLVIGGQLGPLTVTATGTVGGQLGPLTSNNPRA